MAWRADGATHVLSWRQGYEAIRAAGFDPVTDAGVITMEILRRDYLRAMQTFGESYVFYELRQP